MAALIIGLSLRSWLIRLAIVLAAKWRKLLTQHKQSGTRASVRMIIDRLSKRLGVNINHLIWLDITKVNERVRPAAGFELRLLTAEEFARYATDPSNAIDPWLIERGAGPLYFCFAALDH